MKYIKDIIYRKGKWVKYGNKIFPKWIGKHYEVFIGKDEKGVDCYTTTRSHALAVVIVLLRTK